MNQQEREDILELQKIDCNCNDCKFMERNFVKFEFWENWNKEIQLAAFEKKKEAACKAANECEDPVGKKTLFHIYNKMRFLFDRSKLIYYANCSKIDKEITFIPNICQLETQLCFEHRKNN